MYAIFLILATLMVVFGWSVGAGLPMLSMIAPLIPGHWMLGRVRYAMARVFVAGLVVICATTGVFLAVDLVVQEPSGP